MKHAIAGLVAALMVTTIAGAQTITPEDALLWLDFEQEVDGGFKCAASDLRCEISGTPRTLLGGLLCSQYEMASVSGFGAETATEALTVAAWIAPATSPASYQSILYKGLRAGPDVQAIHFFLSLWDGKPEFKYKDAEGAWRGIMRNADNFTIPGAAPVPAADVPAVAPKRWSHVAGTFDRGAITLYLDGEAILSGADDIIALVPNEHPLLLGEAQHPEGNRSYLYDGLIDAVRVLDRALNAAEMEALYREERADHPDGALAISPPMPPGYDPEFAVTLPLVDAWEPGESTVADQTTAVVRPHNGALVPVIDGRPFYGMAMMPEPYAGDEQITLSCRDFAAAGVDLYSEILWSWATPREGCHGWWLGEGQYDFDRIDRRIRAIIAADPDARIFPRCKLNPPRWWLEAHPEDIVLNADGSRGEQASLASSAWEAAYERMLRDLIRHMEASDYAGHIIGYQPAGGRASEWYWWGENGQTDFSPVAIERWREWLREEYGGDAGALREAWGLPDASFAAAQPPSPAERQAMQHGIFRDPVQARNVIDYRRFMSDMVTRNIIRSCRIVKDETGASKIAGVFYGYSLYSIRQCGFQGTAEVLAAPEVDFLCSPTAYDHRRGGDPGSFVSAYHGSYRLHEKLFWDEVDTRTHLYPGFESYRTEDLQETLSVLQRAVGHSLTKGTSLWWFLLAGNATFHQAEVMDEVAKLKDACDEALEVEREQVAEVAVFADEPSMHYTSAADYHIIRGYLRDTVDELARMGAPYDVYLLSDIADERLPEYRLYIFLNAYSIGPDIRAAIDAEVRRDGRTAVWVYAPGYVTGRDCSEDAMADLTGITLRAHEEPVAADLALTGDHAITADAPEALHWAWELAPAFSVDGSDATVLGTVAGRPGLAVREFDDWRSVYSLLPLRREVLRGLCEYAGVHVYSDTFDTFFANSAYAMLHTASAGDKRIELRSPAEVTELVTGRSLGRVDAIQETLPEGVTRIYRLDTTAQ